MKGLRTSVWRDTSTSVRGICCWPALSLWSCCATCCSPTAAPTGCSPWTPPTSSSLAVLGSEGAPPPLAPVYNFFLQNFTRDHLLNGDDDDDEDEEDHLLHGLLILLLPPSSSSQAITPLPRQWRWHLRSSGYNQVFLEAENSTCSVGVIKYHKNEPLDKVLSSI